VATFVAAILTGCNSFVDDPVVGDPVIDGWPVGPEVSCTQAAPSYLIPPGSA